MKEKPCRCGASKKRFQFDIGPFFVNDCCLEAGFDELGNSKDAEPVAPSKPKTVASQIISKVFPKGGRGKLMDMTVAALKELAKSKGVEGADEMTKKPLVAAILERA